METQAADYANAGIRMKEDLGFLHLGKIDQEYIPDPDLRHILAKTVLDSNKTGVFEDQQLRLITSVIFSQCFAVKGNRKKEVFKPLITTVCTVVLGPASPWSGLFYFVM